MPIMGLEKTAVSPPTLVEDSWYLAYIVTHPAHRNKGLARGLIADMGERVRKQGGKMTLLSQSWETVRSDFSSLGLQGLTSFDR